jgi:hypothetical protein
MDPEWLGKVREHFSPVIDRKVQQMDVPLSPDGTSIKRNAYSPSHIAREESEALEYIERHKKRLCEAMVESGAEGIFEDFVDLYQVGVRVRSEEDFLARVMQ